MTQVPLVIYSRGERTVIGSCDVEKTEQGGFELSGIIEHPRYQDLLQSKHNPDMYSVSIDLVEKNLVEVAYVPPVLIPKGRSEFTGYIPHQVIVDEVDWKESNDD